MNKAYENMKNFVKTASDENLKFAYNELNKNLENADLAETLAFTVVTSEMEDRNLLVFDKETFEYKLISRTSHPAPGRETPGRKGERKMDKIYRVTYTIGETERTDDFVTNAENPYYRRTSNGWRITTMADNSTESAIKAIREKFNGVWGFDPDAIVIKSIITGHVEYKTPGNKLRTPQPVFVAD